MELIIIILIIGFILLFLKSPLAKGAMGEFQVNASINLLLDKDKYHLIENVTIPAGNGTTQIDHIIVSEYGVFVIETKNMKGWIYGAQNQKKWTQVIYRHKSQFQNPLHQNYKHTKTLQHLLHLEDDQLHSIVVFIGDTTFKTTMPNNVFNGTRYLKYIKSFTLPVLTRSDVSEIIDKIESSRLTPSIWTDNEHINNVNKAAKEKKSAPSCPKCGKAMVLRTAKNGPHTGNQFWGCSTFPKCRGMRTV